MTEISPRISAPIEEVVADANVLLSAAVGKAALRVLTEFEVTIHATQFNVDEVAEYLPRLIGKYRLPQELVELHWKLLPIKIHDIVDYQGFLDKAVLDLLDRDPEDAHALALARRLGLPLWSNDRHLHHQNVKCYSTTQLLRLLEAASSTRSDR